MMAPRVGFEDLVPVEQDDGPSPVVAIRYRQEYVEAMNLFRAVLVANEMSQRALELTAEAVDMNPANYTAWEFRRRCLKALGSDLHAELRFTEETAYDNPKNYQIWFHRRAVVELLGDPAAELAFINNVLTEDMKNYHAWTYRQWVLMTFGDSHGLWAGELESVHHMLQLDHYNNSAWNQRWFTVSNIHRASWPLPAADVRRELDYAFAWLEKDIHNESPWTYIRGLMRTRAPTAAPLPTVPASDVAPPLTPGSSGGGNGGNEKEATWRFRSFPSLKRKMLALKAGSEAECVPLLGLLLEAYECDMHAVESGGGGALAGEGDDGESEGDAAAALVAAEEVCRALESADAVRAGYWQRRRTRLGRALGSIL